MNNFKPRTNNDRPRNNNNNNRDQKPNNFKPRNNDQKPRSNQPRENRNFRPRPKQLEIPKAETTFPKVNTRRSSVPRIKKEIGQHEDITVSVDIYNRGGRHKVDYIEDYYEDLHEMELLEEEMYGDYDEYYEEED